MADALKQRIALDGGPEIRAELQALGREGEAAFKKLQAAADQLKGPGSAFGNSLKILQDNIQKTGEHLVKLGESTTRVGKSLSESLSLPLAAIGALSVKAFSDFESGLASLSVHIDTTKESLAGIGEAIRNIAGTTPVGIDELTKGLGDIRGAGIGAADGLKILQGASKLAVATNSDVGVSVNLVTSAVKAFGLQGKDIDGVFNILFKTVEGGRLSVADLNDTFGKAALTVKAAGVGMNEYLAALSALTGGGLDAGAAQKDLNKAIDTLTKGGKDASAVLHLLGVRDLPQLIAKSGGFVQALQAIVTAAHGNQTALVQLFGSTQAYGAVLSLVKDQNASFVDELARMKSGADDLGAAFDKQRQTTSKSFQQLKNDLQNAAIDIGGELVPAVTKVVGAIETMVKGFRSLPEGVKAAAVDIGLFVAAVGPAIVVLGTLTVNVGRVVEGVGLLIGALRAAALGIAVINAPIAIAVIALAALGIAVAGIAGRQDVSGKAAKAHEDAIVKLNEAVANLKAGVPGAADALKTLAASQIEAAQAAVKLAQDQLAARKQLLAATSGGISNEDKKDTARVQAQIAQDEADLATRSNELAKLATILNEIDSKTRDTAAGVKNVGDAAGGVGDQFSRLNDKVGVVRGGVTSFASDVGGAFKEVKKSADDTGVVFEKIRNGVIAAVDSTHGFSVAAGEAGAAVKELGTTASSAAQDAAKSLDSIVPSIKAIPEAFTQVGDAINQVSVASQALSQAADVSSTVAAATAVADAINGAQVSITTALSVIADSATRAGQTVGTLPAAFQAVADAGTSMGNAIVAGLASAGQTIGNLSGIANSVSTSFTDVITNIESAFSGLASNVGSIIDGLVSKLAQLKDSIASAQSAAGGQGHAGGGMIRGAGSGISDSIQAWLSNGEFVIKAQAVQHYGADLFAALNNLRMPRGGLALAAGGLAQRLTGPSAAPRYAGGGLVSVAAVGPTGHPVTLSLDGTLFTGLSASEDAIESISRFAMQRKIKNAGRKPAWNK